MGMLEGEGITLCGNFAEVERERPKDWAERDSKWIEPYKYKWRARLGKVLCDCREVEVHYQPYYGFSVYHMKDCAIGKHLKKHPGILNLIDVPFPLMAQSD